jgi:hypothetical protein
MHQQCTGLCDVCGFDLRGHCACVDFELSLERWQTLGDFVDVHWVFSANEKAPRRALAACPFKRTNAVYGLELLMNGLL